MIHVDTRQRDRFERDGHRITGDHWPSFSHGAGYEKADVAIHVATQLDYVEMLPDEKQASTMDFLMPAVT